MKMMKRGEIENNGIRMSERPNCSNQIFQSLGFQGLEFQSLGFRVWGLGVQGLGFSVFNILKTKLECLEEF